MIGSVEVIDIDRDSYRTTVRCNRPAFNSPISEWYSNRGVDVHVYAILGCPRKLKDVRPREKNKRFSTHCVYIEGFPSYVALVFEQAGYASGCG